MKNPKLKTAKDVQKEIFSKYFELRQEVPGGLAVYRSTVPSLRKEICLSERDCSSRLKRIDSDEASLNG
jgi:hypothetical protein